LEVPKWFWKAAGNAQITQMPTGQIFYWLFEMNNLGNETVSQKETKQNFPAAVNSIASFLSEELHLYLFIFKVE
jgi:hypothetical protein